MFDLEIKLLELELGMKGEVVLLLEYDVVLFWMVGSF
jgi:hypothetical protein